MLYRDYLKDKYQNTAVKLANAEGVPCVLEYSKGKNIRNYEVYGNSVQDGTPTPESPVEIQSVGDLTKNLLPYPYYDTTKTINGITFTDNGDGTITVDGTATADIYFFLQSNITLSSGTYIMSGCPTGGSTTTYFIGFGSSTDADIGNGAVRTLPEDRTMNLFIKILNGTAVSNIVFKPQLEEGTTATEYEPYGYKIPIVNSGKNLLPYPYHHTTKTENGITFTDNGDGSVTVSGTATEYVDFGFVQALPCRPNQAYTVVKNGVDVNNVSFVFCDVNENGKITRETVSTTREKTFTVTTLASTAYIKLLMKRQQNNAECTGTVKPTLELGTTATEYEPYRVPVTANIYLDEPLRKIGDYADYIDFKGQRVVRKVGVLDNTSTKPISESLVALAIPTEEPIPLPALKTFKGTNIISVDTSVQPSNIKAKYVRL